MNRYLLFPLIILLAGCTARAQTPTGTQQSTITSAGHEWTYYVHVPKGYDKRTPLPVVLILHGAGGNGKLYLERNNWRKTADKHNFIAVAPDGLPARTKGRPSFLLNPRLWNSGQLRPFSPRSKIDDIQFFNDLLDEVQKKYKVDADRIYVTGHSNGAAMSYMLGAKLSERLAAIAPGMGQNYTKGITPKRPLPTLVLLGTKDPLNPIEGGESKLPWGKRTTPPVTKGLEAWAKVLGCPTKPKLVRNKNHVKIMKYGPGKNGVDLTVYYIDGQGHGWPGVDEAGLPERLIGPHTDHVDANEVIWEFFRKHKKRQ